MLLSVKLDRQYKYLVHVYTKYIILNVVYDKSTRISVCMYMYTKVYSHSLIQKCKLYF